MLYYVAVAVAGLVALKVLVTLLEPRLAFYPLAGEMSTPRDRGLPFEEVTLKTADGENVRVWILPHKDARAEVLFWHGNGGNLSLWLDAIAGIHQQGLSVVALDYRGYGLSTGTPTEEGLYRDTEALVHDFWRARHRAPNAVVYWGRSLGATMAAYATTIRRPDGVILESAFPDKSSLLTHYPLYRILSVFSRYKFPTAEFLREFKGPALVLHGDRDSIVPFTEGRKLFERLQTDKAFVTIAGADHNDLLPADDEGYWRPIRQFIEQVHAR